MPTVEDYSLANQIRTCMRCPIMVQQRVEDNGKAVPAEVGSQAPSRPLGILCEAPGAQEAATSRPLVGSAGRIFDGLLHEAGIRREELVILNRVRCRPPHNRLAEAPGSVEACDAWTKIELETYQPPVVVVMGGTALQAVFGAKAKVGESRGMTRHTGDTFLFGARAWVATYHPASLLPNRSPWNREMVISDLVQARELWESMR